MKYETAETIARNSIRIGLGGVVVGLLSVLLLACGDGESSVEPTELLVSTESHLPEPQTALDLAPGGLADSGSPVITAGPGGKIVVLVIGMSNARIEGSHWSKIFRHRTWGAEIAENVELVNCAQGGRAVAEWLGTPSLWDDCREDVQASGWNLADVRVIWSKVAHREPTTWQDLAVDVGLLTERMETEFPSLQAVYHSSRIYGGYVTERFQETRGEPVSFEGGLAVNAAVEAWTGGVWMGWGPYLWADGPIPNGSGLIWLPEDFRDRPPECENCDYHPSNSGAKKVAFALHDFFLGTDWYGS